MKFPFKQEIEVRSTGRNRLLYSDKFFDTEIVKDVNGYSSSGCGAQNRHCRLPRWQEYRKKTETFLRTISVKYGNLKRNS